MTKIQGSSSTDSASCRPPLEPDHEPPHSGFDATLAEARSKFADMLSEDLEAVIEEAVAAARAVSPVPKADIDAEIGTKKHGGGKEE